MYASLQDVWKHTCVPRLMQWWSANISTKPSFSGLEYSDNCKDKLMGGSGLTVIKQTDALMLSMPTLSAVSRGNRTSKGDSDNQLAKICAETGWKRLDVPPMALRLIASTTHKFPRLYSHEILMNATSVSSSATTTSRTFRNQRTLYLYYRAITRVSRSHSQAQETLPPTWIDRANV